MALFLFGFSWACANAQWALDDRLRRNLDGETRWVEGRVVGLPQNGDGVVRFELADARSRRAKLPAAVAPGLVRRAAGQQRRALAPGGQIEASCRAAQSPRLRLRSLAAGATHRRHRHGQGWPATRARPAWAWRDGIRQRLLAVDAQGRTGALAALVLGDGAGLSREDWQVLQDTGTVHLLVISGQHIGLLAGLVYLLIAGLARYGLWPSRLPWLPWACGLAFARGARLWLAGRLRRARAAGLRDDRSGAVVASALSSSGRLVAVVAGAQRRSAAGPAGESATGVLVVFCGGGGVDLHFRRPAGSLALVANLDPRAVADRDRFVPDVAGTGVADQSQRAAGQFAGRALDQSGGAAAGLAGDTVAARALCRRRACCGWRVA